MRNPGIEQAFQNLLAVIFRDGGHRADDIGDLTLAGDEAERVVTALRGQCSRLEHENQTLRSKLLGVNGVSPRPGSSTL